jgi:hypothetical protein
LLFLLAASSPVVGSAQEAQPGHGGGQQRERDHHQRHGGGPLAGVAHGDQDDAERSDREGGEERERSAREAAEVSEEGRHRPQALHKPRPLASRATSRHPSVGASATARRNAEDSGADLVRFLSLPVLSLEIGFAAQCTSA